MNIQLLLAAFLASIITAGHPFIGEKYFFGGIDPTSYPHSPFGDGDVTRRPMKIAWHLLTIALFMSSFALFALALTSIFESPRTIARFIFWQFVLFTLIVWALAIFRPIILIRVPLWIATGGIAVGNSLEVDLIEDARKRHIMLPNDIPVHSPFSAS